MKEDSIFIENCRKCNGFYEYFFKFPEYLQTRPEFFEIYIESLKENKKRDFEENYKKINDSKESEETDISEIKVNEEYNITTTKKLEEKTLNELSVEKKELVLKESKLKKLYEGFKNLFSKKINGEEKINDVEREEK